MAEMEEEMEDVCDEDVGVGAVDFVGVEVDFEYEFEASKYFDFCRPESLLEARAAELWFETKGGYPPSPFISKIDLGLVNLAEDQHIPPDCNNVVNTSDASFSEDGFCLELHTVEESEGDGVLEFESSKISKYSSKFNAKTPAKLPVAGRSTLMKPTASHLAKSNVPKNIKSTKQNLARSKNSSTQNSDSSCLDECDGTNQATKRQKLDGGHSRKVHDLKQPMHLVHKNSQKKEQNEGNPGIRRPKITIPKEPDLGTARRALRSRPSKSKEESQAPTSTIFKARPLNRKILEAPTLPLHQRSTPGLPQFQEFHLKTSERAIHHASSIQIKNGAIWPQPHASAHDRLQPNPSVSHMKYLGDNLRRGQCKTELFNVEARLLSEKVLSRSKKEKTKPLEFNSGTEKQWYQALPIDFSDKLSLISDDHPSPASGLTCSLGSKENIYKDKRHDCKTWRQPSIDFRSRSYLCTNGSIR
ncbi:protein TPX2-like [Wolffia australiana]